MTKPLIFCKENSKIDVKRVGQMLFVANFEEIETNVSVPDKKKPGPKLPREKRNPVPNLRKAGIKWQNQQ